MRALILAIFFISNSVTGQIQLSPNINAPFSSNVQKRSFIDDEGNRTTSFIETKSLNSGMTILYQLSEAIIASENITKNLLTGWDERVIQGMESANIGVSYRNSYVFNSSESTKEHRYEIEVIDPKMKKYLRDGYGFGSGSRIIKNVFIQIGTQCFGFSQLECERKFKEFGGNIRLNY